MEVYVDIVFVVNLFMNIFILWVVNLLARKRCKYRRLALGGFLMSFIYLILILFAPLRGVSNILTSVFLVMVGVIVTFSPRSIKDFLGLMGLSYVSAFMLGGFGFALFYLIGISIPYFSFRLLLVSVTIFYLGIKIFLRIFKRRQMGRQVFYLIKIYYKEGDVTLTALVDTGNSLYDPLSDAPVIIAEFNCIKHFLPDVLRLRFYENKENDVCGMATALEVSEFKIRLIPFVSIGKQNGMLLGFRPDKVEIHQDNNIIILNNVVVGIYNCRLSRDGTYQGLLNPELIT